MYYLRRDHQGSITGLIDEEGGIVNTSRLGLWRREVWAIGWRHLLEQGLNMRVSGKMRENGG